MTRTVAGLVLSVMATVALGAQSFTMTDDQIQQAVTAGQKAKGKRQGLVLRDTAAGIAAAMAGSGSSATNGFWLEAFTPLSWIQQQASNAAKEYRTITAANVDDTWREPVFRVLVHPDTPTNVTSDGIRFSASVQHVVLRSEDRKIVIQPLTKEQFTEDAQNGFGAKVTYSGVAAQFPMDALRELRGPKGDKEFLITVIGTGREEKNFKVKKKHFEDLK